MKQPTKIPPHQSYVMRFWYDEPNQMWRVTLQHVQTGEQRHFQNVDTLCQYIQQGVITNVQQNYNL